ncbi:ABC transporter ATP-binding protein [Anaeromicropila herbilytica]|uniref:Bacitracin ABC transporter ATP-binding protein n=1 Tax=Anaeromicropila herbilytica TaxID=2785025 RepID=A0A7R7IDP2_9FIRM|nr:ABC transporter ATP-binding protein [Anaeromicropila herbilytica]BCN30218.1 bacitracin ABC transporter ATP-binding protein [Anaeromicropila herbilytica]
MQDNNIIMTRKLSKNFGDFTALHPTDIHIQKGDIYALIGKNGAGKTTMLKMFTGQLRPDSGDIFLFGYSAERELLNERQKIGAIIETPGFFPNFTAKQNLEYYRIQRGIPDRLCVQRALEEVNLTDTGKKKFADFSLGMKQRLGLALALMTHPALLILDEPTNGLDPEGIVEIRSLLRRLNQEKNITVLISSHILTEVHTIANRFAFIDHGKIIEELTKEELEKKSSKYLMVKVDNVENASVILERNCKDVDYTILPDNNIRINGYLEESDRINKILADHGVRVFSIYQKGENLEEYFLKLIGGGLHA